ncbi:MAG: hypothetical protein ACRDWY_14950, partial [Actinomycetes bacterium]
VTLAATGAQLRVALSGRDEGGLSLTHLRDRVEAAGGTVTMRRFGTDVVLEALLPAGEDRGAANADGGERVGQGATADHSATSRSGPNADFVT